MQQVFCHLIPYPTSTVLSTVARLAVSQADLPDPCSARTEAAGSICIDSHGKACRLCGQPLSMYSSYQDYIVRDDCGNQSDWSPQSKVPLVSMILPRGTGVLPPRTGPPTSWTNGWCELNIQKAIADADANRDYFYYAATFIVRPGFAYDYSYCQHNGFISDDLAARVHDYDYLCADITRILCTACDG